MSARYRRMWIRRISRLSGSAKFGNPPKVRDFRSFSWQGLSWNGQVETPAALDAASRGSALPHSG